MTIQNGESQGSHRVSSATVRLNGTTIASPSDFNPNVGRLDRAVTLAATNTLTAQLQSAPDSYLTLSVCASSNDTVPPSLTFTAPPAVTRDSTPDAIVRYSDAGTGPNTNSLRILVDGQDRTSLFAKRSDEASGEVVPVLPEGVHQIRAEIRDGAGNLAVTERQFTVDTTPPALAFSEPIAGSYVAQSPVPIRLTYSDSWGLDAASLRLRLNGADISSSLERQAGEAVGLIALAPGASTLVASVRDLAGNEALATMAIALDLQPPTVNILQPGDGSRLGVASPEVLIQYGDDQPLDATGLVVRLDGTVLTGVITGTGLATALLGPLSDGTHVLNARLADRAGHLTSASASFSVDTTLPDLEVLYPLPGLLIADPSPRLHATVGDAQGVDPASLRVRVNGVDRTGQFTLSNGVITGDLLGLVDGENVVECQVADAAGNRAVTRVAFRRDTTSPHVAFLEPLPNAPLATARPRVAVEFGDEGSGVDPGLTTVLLDDVDVSTGLVLGPTGAELSLQADLLEGAHRIRFIVQDRAGNRGEASRSFLVDTVPPRLAFLQPFAGQFVNDDTPVVRVSYQDDGSGVDPGAFALYRIDADGRATEVSGFTVGPNGATGELMTVGPGTQRLRARIRDLAGNEAGAEVGFELDSAPPVASVLMPGAGDYAGTPTPPIMVGFWDDRSGVDLGLLQITIDGDDRTGWFQLDEGGASLLWPALEGLADGEHAIGVIATDRAGNATQMAPHRFFIDTTPPLLAILAPGPGARLGDRLVDIVLSASDSSAAGVFAVHVAIDDVDRTPEFTVDGPQWRGRVAVDDGAHELRITAEDWAGNVVERVQSFRLDATPPQVSWPIPQAWTVFGATPIEVRGTILDGDPDAVVVVRSEAGDAICEGQFACLLPLQEGLNHVTLSVRDAIGHVTTMQRAVTLDTQPPQVTILEPPPGFFARTPTLVVSGLVVDATDAQISVNGVAASVADGHFGATVAMGSGPVFTVEVVAVDRAGNTARASVEVHRDEEAPRIHISRPLPGAYVRGPFIDVSGTISDGSWTTIDVNGRPAEVHDGSFEAQLSVVEGPLEIVATARDSAGNESAARVGVTVDSVPPAIAIQRPLPGSSTQAPSLVIEGSVADATPIVLRIDGDPVEAEGSSFAVERALPAEGTRTFVLSATDAAANTSTASVSVRVDRTPPSLDILSPSEGARVAPGPLLVTGTVGDIDDVAVVVNGAPAVVTGSAWQIVLSLEPGPQSLVVVARDAAGNESHRERAIVLAAEVPTLSIESPEGTFLTNLSHIEISGRVESAGAAIVTVNGVPVTVEEGRFVSNVSLLEGDNLIDVVATASGQTVEATVLVVRDTIPPAVTLDAPGGLARGRVGAVAATATDAHGIAEIVIEIDGTTAATCATPTCSSLVTIPTESAVGSAIRAGVRVQDFAGNTARADGEIAVLADAMVSGVVMDDATSLPLGGVSVVLASTEGTAATTTDARGRYTLKALGSVAALKAYKLGMTSVERIVATEPGVGTVPVDLRVRELAPVGADGSQVTRLSTQGLPGLLPLGWVPRAAARVDAGSSWTVEGLPDIAVHLVRYDESLHSWTMVSPVLLPQTGAIAVPLQEAGSYALVSADSGGPTIPPVAQVLPGVEVMTLPESTTMMGEVAPVVIPASGGTAAATVSLEASPLPPSGTVVQASITERYTLNSGEVASAAERQQDILVYRSADAALSAQFPVTPSRQYDATEISGGAVHLDILAGRESVRGRVGGNSPLILERDGLRVSVPGAALPEDTVISVRAAVAPMEGVSVAGLGVLGDYEIDLSGQALGLPAELSVAADGIGDGEFVLARVERLFGVAHLVTAGRLERVGDRLVSRPDAGLSGVTVEGRYLLLRLDTPIAFIRGHVVTAGTPTRAVVASDTLALEALSDASGAYTLAVPVGATTLRAFVPGTSLAARATLTAAPDFVAVQDLSLEGAASIATVMPSDGTTGVARSTNLRIEAALPFDPGVVGGARGQVNLVALPTGVQVPTHLALSADRRVVTVVPTEGLESGTSYRLTAAGLTDAVGGVVMVPATTFTTRADGLSELDPTRLAFSLPDIDGTVRLTALPASFPAGTRVLVVNTNSAFVATFDVENDGGLGSVVPATLKASISDTLLITLTDSLGRATTVRRSQFEDRQTGVVAVGPGGGVVRAADGSDAELRIPEGALLNGAHFKIHTSASIEDLPEPLRTLPDFPDAEFAGAIQIESVDAPAFAREAKIAFPPPANLSFDVSEARFHVVRRIDGPQGPVFETIDDAEVEQVGSSVRIVTASWPQAGYVSSFGGFGDLLQLLSTTVNNLYLLAVRQIQGRSPAGAITGHVRRARWGAAAMPTYEGVRGALVSMGTLDNGVCRPLQDAGDDPPAAVSQTDGTYTVVDPHYDGGPVVIAATVEGQTACVEAYEVLRADAEDLPAAQRLLDRYSRVATADVSFSAQPPPPPPAAIDIDVFVVEGERLRPVSTAATLGAALLVRLTAAGAANLTATVQGLECPVAEEGPGKSTLDLSAGTPCHPLNPGLYTIVARGLSAFGQPVTASRSLLVVATGEANTQPIPDAAPVVLETVPRNRSVNISPSTLPQLTFSEPVRVNGGVSLRSGEVELPCRLLGTTPEAEVVDLALAPGARVTSLTLQPLAQLAYGTTYSLSWTSAVRDVDEPPKSVEPGEAQFQTLVPEVLSSSEEKFGSPGLAVVDGRAYLVQALAGGKGRVRVFDVSDPAIALPVAQDPEGYVVGLPLDVVAQGSRVVVATGPKTYPQPSNLYVFDVSDPRATKWVGAASASVSSMAGTVTRLAIRDGLVYAAVSKQGVKVVELGQVETVFGDPNAGSPMTRGLTTDGLGFATDSVSPAVPVMSNGRSSYIYDIDVGDFQIDEAPDVLVATTGEVPLALVSPRDQLVYPQAPIEDANHELRMGYAVALTRLGSRQVAVVAGYGTANGATIPLLAVVDVSDPRAVTTLSVLDLSAQAGNLTITDVLVKDGVAFVGLQEGDLAHAEGLLLVVSLGDGTHPTFNHALRGIGGRLALGEGNVLLGTARAYSGSTGPLGGIRQVALGATIGLLDDKKQGLARIRLPQNFTTYVTANVPQLGETISVEAAIIETRRDNAVREPGRLPTLKQIDLRWDATTGRYVGPLRIVDRDCAVTLKHDPDTDEQLIDEPCVGDLESGPWTKLRLRLSSQLGGLERVVDIHAFRLVALGDSLTQGVQHGIVVHQHQRYSFPAQVANQINKYLKATYGQQVLFRQAMIGDPGIGRPKELGRPFDREPAGGFSQFLGFPVPARLDSYTGPVNNLGMSGARALHLFSSADAKWPPYCPDVSDGAAFPPGSEDRPPFCDLRPANFETLRNRESPVFNYEAPKSVWPYVIGGLGRTAVGAAQELDPSLLVIQIGNNDVMNAVVDADLNQLTDESVFKSNYDELLTRVNQFAKGRADLIVATVPDVSSIPHMLNPGEPVGPLPFRLDAPFLDQEKMTRGLENSPLPSVDETGSCLGLEEPNGACILDGTKIPLKNAVAAGGFFRKLGVGLTLVNGGGPIRIKRRSVLTPERYQRIQDATDSLNEHVLRRAAEQDAMVMDVKSFFAERSQPAALNDPTLLGGSFTGTPWRAPRPKEKVRGIGNSLLSWDGIHANSAGYAASANLALTSLRQRLLSRAAGGLDQGAEVLLIPSGSAAEEGSITWLLTHQYLELARTRFVSGRIVTVR